MADPAGAAGAPVGAPARAAAPRAEPGSFDLVVLALLFRGVLLAIDRLARTRFLCPRVWRAASGEGKLGDGVSLLLLCFLATFSFS